MIKKVTYRDEVKRSLLEAMFKGEICPGQRISLPKIAGELEVSVTPVREALTQLAEARIVTYVPNRGFIVTELSIDEVLELYEVITLLETSALLSAAFTERDITKLEKVQQQFTLAKNKEKRVFYDMRFHQLLIDPSANSLIKKLIDDLRIRVFFYELEYMLLDEKKQVSEGSHELIIENIKKGKMAEAASALRENWALSISTISTKMKANA